MLNEYNAMGRLVANPDYAQTQAGTSRCRFTIAVDRMKGKDGQQQADFIPCIAWGNVADMISQRFSKGKPIIITGALQNNNYTDKDGVTHYQMHVVVSKVSFVLSDSNGNGSSQPQQSAAQGYAPPPTYPKPKTNKQFTPLPSENVEDLDDYEEIISDGEIPF